MPTYSYLCKKCGYEFDLFHGMTESPKVKCASCGSIRCERLMGTGAGIIFKGSGFYETDFKDKKGAKPAAETAKAGGGDAKTSEAAPAAKPEAKTESKLAKKEHAKPAAKKD